MKPVIGLTPTPKTETQIHGTFRELQLNDAYQAAVAAAGGVPVMLTLASDPGEALDVVDGLLLTGGGDIDPERYGDRSGVDPRCYMIDEERDRFELDLLRLALERDIPVFGICRGLQVINVGLGGTLWQHVDSGEDEKPGGVHRQQEAGLPSHEVGHAVALADHPAAAAIAPDRAFGVNSFHHQGIRDLAPWLEAIATAPDGLVEAVAIPALTFGLGVQWHPELMFRADPAHLRPFVAHVEAARARKMAVAR